MMRLHEAWPHGSEQTPQSIYRTPMEGQGGNNGLTWHLPPGRSGRLSGCRKRIYPIE